MIIACGLPYKMLDEQARLDVIQTVRQHLLTPKGLRTLSPRNPLYKGSQEGTPEERDFAGKNGSVWPWLLEFYVQACFDINGDAFLSQAEEILEGFEEDIQSYGIGPSASLFDADPPYAPRGAISQAWSVASRTGHPRHDSDPQGEQGGGTQEKKQPGKLRLKPR